VYIYADPKITLNKFSDTAKLFKRNEKIKKAEIFISAFLLRRSFLIII